MPIRFVSVGVGSEGVSRIDRSKRGRHRSFHQLGRRRLRSRDRCCKGHCDFFVGLMARSRRTTSGTQRPSAGHGAARSGVLLSCVDCSSGCTPSTDAFWLKRDRHIRRREWWQHVGHSAEVIRMSKMVDGNTTTRARVDSAGSWYSRRRTRSPRAARWQGCTVGMAPLLLFAITGCGPSDRTLAATASPAVTVTPTASANPATTAPTIETGKTSLGTVLTDSKGHTLYYLSTEQTGQDATVKVTLASVGHGTWRLQG